MKNLLNQHLLSCNKFVWQIRNNTTNQTAGDNENIPETNKDNADTNKADKAVDDAIKDAKTNPDLADEIKEATKKYYVDTRPFEKRFGSFLSRLFPRDKWKGLFGGSDKNKNNMGTSRNIENLPKNEAIIAIGENLIDNNDIAGAAHCTDWVSKVYGKAGLIANADAGKSIYNKMDQNERKYTGTPASLPIINQAYPGCYVVFQNNNNSTSTHGVLIKKNLGNGNFEIMSYPGNNKSPRTETVNLNPNRGGYPVFRIKEPPKPVV